MTHYISPYVKPEVKRPVVDSYYNTNPYMFTQTASKQYTKIGITSEEQRLLSRKILRICEGLVYVMNNWTECRVQLELDGHETIKELKISSISVFKNLLDEYIQKLLLEPLNLVLDAKKFKCVELMEILMGNPYLLGFETRVIFFKMAAFAFSGDFNRTINFLIQLMRKKHSSIPDQAISKQSKQKVKIDRSNFLD